MFTNLICSIEITLGNLKFTIGNPWFWAGSISVLIVLWRWWGIKKLLSFTIVISLLFYLMIRVETIVSNYFGEGEGSFFAMMTKPFFIALAAFVFFYYGFLRKDS